MYEIDKVKFGEFISQLRKEKGITQKELASQLFISDKAVSKWETGHSVPDITLLVPLAELLGVTVTELLECHRIEQADKMDVSQTEDLVKRIISLSEDEKIFRPRIEKRNVLIFLTCVLLAVSEVIGLHQLKHAYYFELQVMLIIGMSILFGVYFWFFMREKLPAYYDENKINIYVDGIMHMNMPGVYFNNNNWPYIVRALRIWSLLGMTIFPILYLVISSILADFRPVVDVLIVLALVLGGLFIPVYILGRKHMYSSDMLMREQKSNSKKVMAVASVIMIIFFLFATGIMNGRMEVATRIGCIESANRSQWSMDYRYCDGFMQRTMWLESEDERLNLEIETEDGSIAVEIKDMNGNVLFEQGNMQSGNYEVVVSRQYVIRIQAEEHSGGFSIGY